MKTGLRAPEVLTNGGVVGNATANELAAVIGDVQAWTDVEHTDEGGHKDITATSIQVTGGSVSTGNVTAQSGTAAEAQLGSLSNITAEPVEYGVLLGGKTHGFELYARPAAAPGTTGQELRLTDLSHTLTSVLRIVWNTADSCHMLGVETGGALMLGFPSSATSLTSVNAKTFWSRDGYAEYSRTANIGDYTAVTFSASNFAGVGATLTVSGANVVEHKYRRTGHTLRGKIFVQGATTSGAGATEIDITLPDSAVAAGRNPGSIWLNLNGAYEWGTTQTSAGGSVLKIFRQDPAATFGAYAGTLGFRGEYEIEVA